MKKWGNFNMNWILDNIKKKNKFPRCDNGIVVVYVLILKTCMLKDLRTNIILTSYGSEKLKTHKYIQTKWQILNCWI